jgi:hypothetical protein
MLIFGRVGLAVRIHYNAKRAPSMPCHGKVGRLAVVSRGKPRNHGVEVEGRVVVVPCGNVYAFRGPE